MQLASKLEAKQDKEQEVKYDYDIYNYFISCVDTYAGEAIVSSIRSDHVEGHVPHKIIGKLQKL